MCTLYIKFQTKQDVLFERTLCSEGTWSWDYCFQMSTSLTDELKTATKNEKAPKTGLAKWSATRYKAEQLSDLLSTPSKSASSVNIH